MRVGSRTTTDSFACLPRHAEARWPSPSHVGSGASDPGDGDETPTIWTTGRSWNAAASLGGDDPPSHDEATIARITTQRARPTIAAATGRSLPATCLPCRLRTHGHRVCASLHKWIAS